MRWVGCGLVIDGGNGEINNNGHKSRSLWPVLGGGLPSGDPAVDWEAWPAWESPAYGVCGDKAGWCPAPKPLSPRGPRGTPDPPLPYSSVSNWFRTQGGKWGLAPQPPVEEPAEASL